MKTTCIHCDATWSGYTRCHCGNCHNTFSGVTTFDAHRRGYGERGSCKDPRYMPALVLDDAGVWSACAGTGRPGDGDDTMTLGD